MVCTPRREAPTPGERRGQAKKLAMLIGAALVSFQTLAADPHRSMSPRRQLAACMNRQMAASRTLSYNAANASCTAQLKSKTPALASTDPPKSASASPSPPNDWQSSGRP